MPLTVMCSSRINEPNNSKEVGISHLLPHRQDGTSVFKLCNTPMVWDCIDCALRGETWDQKSEKKKSEWLIEQWSDWWLCVKTHSSGLAHGNAAASNVVGLVWNAIWIKVKVQMKKYETLKDFFSPSANLRNKTLWMLQLPVHTVRSTPPHDNRRTNLKLALIVFEHLHLDASQLGPKEKKKKRLSENLGVE